MKGQRKTWKFILSILFSSIIGGLAFNFLALVLTPEIYSQELGFWFGPIVALFVGLVIIIYGFIGTKIVEDSIPYDNAKDFPSRLKDTFDKIGYRMETEHNNVSEWKYVGAGWSGNVKVQLGDTSAKVIGPKPVVKELKEAFEAPRE